MNGIVYSDDFSLANLVCESAVKNGLCCETMPINEALSGRGSGEAQLIFVVIGLLVDDTLNLIDRCVSQSQAKVVVVGSTANASLVVECIRRGAFDYIDLQSEIANEIASLVRRLDATSNETHPKPPSIAVLSTGDVSDADLVALNFASDLASAAGGCCLLELRFWGAALGSRLQLDPHHTLDDLLAHTRIDPQMLAQALYKHSSGIQLLSGSTHVQPRSPTDDRITAPFLQYARSQNMPTVIGFDDFTSHHNLASVFECHSVVVCSRLDITSLWRTEKRLRHLLDAGIAKERIHVVTVDFDNGFHPTTDEIRKALHEVSLHMIPINAAEQTVSTNVGQPVINQYPRSVMSMGLKAARRQITADEPEQVHGLRRRLLQRMGLQTLMTN